ncbi:MAG: GNAT family N-acetyltransferase [Chitinophagaceae bacterium]
MRFNTIIPILYSSDVLRSLDYYCNVLGFADRWEWGDPVDFGGIFKDGIEIFFCKDGQGNPGTWFSIMVDDVDVFYEQVKAKGAEILLEPVSREWGVREMLIKDPDGHRIRVGHGITLRKKSEQTMPGIIRIIERMPSPDELKYIATAIGWSQPDEKPAPAIPLSCLATTVIAEDTASNTVIGCAFLLTDQANFYYVRNVMVHPDWQGKRVGTALMQALTDWINKNADNKAMIALHTGEHLASFYKQFGFNRSFSMTRFINRNA